MNGQVEDETVNRVAELLNLKAGLRSDSSLHGRLRRCILEEAARLGESTLDYVTSVITGDGALQSLLNRVTVQETAFFRHPEHFESLAREILPGAPRPVTIWSAGCANGQEAFSLAMVLAELRIPGSVIATDVSTAALARTTAAHYTGRELSGLSPDRIARHMSQAGKGFIVNADLRSRVTVLRHNLIEPIPAQVRSAQVIFCRNVLIYFSPGHTRRFLERVADGLPGAALFLGSAETAWTVSERFEPVRTGNAFYYRLRNSSSLDGRHMRSPSPTAEPHDVPALSRRAVMTAPAVAPAPQNPTASITDTTRAATLAGAGQRALNEGRYESAVSAFRKWAYLTPDDPLAHLHLGLAMEASGDLYSAARAFRTAHRTTSVRVPEPVDLALGGYPTDELLRLLDTKGRELAP